MGIEVVEDDVDGGVRISGDDAVHEIEKLDAPAPLLVSGGHLAGGHLEGGKQRRGAVALVVVAMAGQRPPVRAASDSPGHAPGPGSRAFHRRR